MENKKLPKILTHNPNVETMTEDANFIFKEALYENLDRETKKCIRTIMFDLELILDKKSDQFKIMRKRVLDAINDLMREVETTLERNKIIPK